MPDGGVPPYPAYAIAVMHYPARFCRPDKRSAIRHVFWSKGRTSCPLYCRMAALPYPAYGIVLFCRPDKRSAIRHVLGARVEHPARFLPDGGIALSGLRAGYLCPTSASFFVIFTNALQ
ncbi:hypothetical protein FJP64_01535 [Kosakonia cowanii]|nr:hypothetical protein FJP70_02515 [Kosakonia cowanii]TPD92389.1 hypothetical protein FJP67_02515 [Kosakonia cowanii]TPE08940.1 hypothetical protein FJP64_01535 [Kosakonia cowanii]